MRKAYNNDAFEMPQYVLDRVMNKRGRLHVFDALQPERTAFAIIDMQNAFVKGKVKAETATSMPATRSLRFLKKARNSRHRREG